MNGLLLAGLILLGGTGLMWAIDLLLAHHDRRDTDTDEDAEWWKQFGR